MGLPTKPVLVGMFLGAAAATGLYMTGSGADIRAFAEDALTPAFDASRFVIFDDSLFSVTMEPTVSTEALETTTIRKIEFGRTSMVKITTTTSGTYSTDGFSSPHIRYPGIQVDRLTGRGTPVQNVAFWSDRSGWIVAPMLDAHSVITIGGQPAAEPLKR